MPELLGLPYSPWSEKARWALEARRVPYVSRTYAPLVGEPALRLKLGKWRGPVSVPVLTTDDGDVIAGSDAIARWADGRGQGELLYPAEHATVIDRHVARSEVGLTAARALSLARMRGDDEALAEMVPRPLRRVLGGAAARLGRFGIDRTRRKYGGDAASDAAHARVLTGVLAELRAALAATPDEGGRVRTVLGRFTFADIALAQLLAFVEPPSFGLRLGRASRRSFTDPELRARYADLVEWRNALYEAYRPRR